MTTNVRNPLEYTLYVKADEPALDPFVTADGGVGGTVFVGPTDTAPAVIGTEDTVTADGSKVVSFVNGGVEVASVSKDGQLTQGVTWDDVMGPSLVATGSTALVQEAFGDTTWQCAYWKHNANETIHYAFQLPHRWNRGEVRLHAHIVPMANPSAPEVIRMDGHYAWAKYATAVPLAASWTAFSASHTVGTTDALKPTIVSLFSTTPTGAKESDFLMVSLRRPGIADAADTYKTNKVSGTPQANVALLNADVHFQVVKSGTVTEIPT